MSTVAVIQARLNSARFPRKALADLCGMPVIAHVVTRALQIRGVDRVIVAVPSTNDALAITPALPRDDRLSIFCPLNGSVAENDVLGRFVAAVEFYPECDMVMRLTGDCPLIQPEVCERVLELYWRGPRGLAYYTWTDTHSGDWPDGLDCEVMSREWLEDADAKATDATDREHVTPWIRRYSLIGALPPDPKYIVWPKVSIDTPDDLKVVSRIMGALAPC